MQHQHGHAARTYSMEMQQGHAAWTYTMDMQHVHVSWASLNQILTALNGNLQQLFKM
jgi:hypothetical protein